jgi:hypothetical protein
MMLSYRFEVGVFHGILGGDPFRMVILEHLRQNIKRFVIDQVSVALINELAPGFLRMLRQNVVVVAVQLHVVLFNVFKEFFRAQHLCYFD